MLRITEKNYRKRLFEEGEYSFTISLEKVQALVLENCDIKTTNFGFSPYEWANFAKSGTHVYKFLRDKYGNPTKLEVVKL